MAIGACRCQQRCENADDITRIINNPPEKLPLDYLVSVTEKEAYKLNRTLQQYKPDEFPKDPIPVQCSAAIIGTYFSDIDIHVDDAKWEMSESTLKEYESLERSFFESSNSRVRRGLFGFFKKVVKGIVKIAQTIATVVQVVKKIVSFVGVIISIIKDIRAIIKFFG